MSLISSWRAWRRSRDEAAAGSFEDLIAAELAGKTLKPEAVDLALKAAGKTIEDLEAEIRRIMNRRRAAQQVEAARDAGARLLEVDEAIRQADADLAHAIAQAKARHAQEVATLQAERLELAEAVEEGRAAAVQVRELTHPKFAQQLEAIASRRRAWAAQASDLSRRQARARETIDGGNRGLARIKEQGGKISDEVFVRRRQAEAEGDLAKLEHEAREVQAELDAIDREADDVRRQAAEIE